MSRNKSTLETYASLVKTSNGKDKIIRLCTYCSRLIGVVLAGNRPAATGPASAIKFNNLSNQLSSCRVILRLCDDIPAALTTKSYGFGMGEKHAIMSLLGIASHLASQLYYPFEHVSWLGELRFLPVDSTRWKNWSTIIWWISLQINVIRNLIEIHDLRTSLRKLNKQKSMDVLEARDGATSSGTDNKIRRLRQLLHVQIIELVRNFSDLMNAVNWMPKGFLWSGKLSPVMSALFGIISSVGHLYLASLRVISDSSV